MKFLGIKIRQPGDHHWCGSPRGDKSVVWIHVHRYQRQILGEWETEYRAAIQHGPLVGPTLTIAEAYSGKSAKHALRNLRRKFRALDRDMDVLR